MVASRLSRCAFTMIELIFAIVIIAISVMSLPMVTQITSAGMEKNLVQEAIFASIAEITLVTTYAWDENSLMDDYDSDSSGIGLSRVLNIDNSCLQTGEFVGNTEIIRRIGHVNRKCLNETSIGRYSGSDYLYALETAEHSYSTIFTGETGASGYKNEYDSLLEIEDCDSGNCVKFGNENNNINLKEITLSIRKKDDDTNEVVTLFRTYAANIGEVAYANEVLQP